MRCGSSLGSYVRTGTLSNNAFTGAGIENRSLILFVCLLKVLELELEGLMSVSFPSSGGIGTNSCQRRDIVYNCSSELQI